MDNNKNELSNRVTAFFSWLDFLGLLLLIVSGTVLKQYGWLLLLASLCLFSSFIYKTVSDWQEGRRKLARNRLIIFIVVLVIAIVIGVLAANK